MNATEIVRSQDRAWAAPDDAVQQIDQLEPKRTVRVRRRWRSNPPPAARGGAAPYCPGRAPSCTRWEPRGRSSASLLAASSSTVCDGSSSRFPRCGAPRPCRGGCTPRQAASRRIGALECGRSACAGSAASRSLNSGYGTWSCSRATASRSARPAPGASRCDWCGAHCCPPGLDAARLATTQRVDQFPVLRHVGITCR